MFQSLESRTNQHADIKKKKLGNKKNVAKSIKDILGKDAEMIPNLKLADAPGYFDENEEQRDQIDNYLKKMQLSVQPVDIKEWILYGISPKDFDKSSMNPLRQAKFDAANKRADEQNSKRICCFKYN